MTATPARSIKVPNSEWDPAKARAAENGETTTALVRRAIRRELAGRSYLAEVYRDGKWWMIYVPEIDGLTQARNESEVWQMARDLIAVTLDGDPYAIDVELVILPAAKDGQS